jgi:hypothetical protein
MNENQRDKVLEQLNQEKLKQLANPSNLNKMRKVFNILPSSAKNEMMQVVLRRNQNRGTNMEEAMNTIILKQPQNIQDKIREILND